MLIVRAIMKAAAVTFSDPVLYMCERECVYVCVCLCMCVFVCVRESVCIECVHIVFPATGG